MAKKNNKKFRITIEVPKWNKHQTTVLCYDKQDIFICAKSAVKAIALLNTKHAILCINRVR